MKSKNITRHFALRSMIFTTLIVLFFLSGIVAYYAMLYSETREHITKIGELNALTSSEQIDKYFSSGVDTLKLSGYTLDNMIRNGNSPEIIHEYLLNQSIAISNITSGNSPGLYGYINGQYISGTGWIAGNDYVATERPWYIDAQASVGRDTVVGPYLDKRTNTNIVTLSKTLCDVKSVIAMDFSMVRLQAITEEVTSQGDSYAEIVLNRDYEVLAHSDKSEIGKNYLQEQNTFGNKLVDELRDTNQDFFSLNYNGSDYIVYTTTVANDWFCISVIDATAALNHHNLPLIFMFAAAFAIFTVQIIILKRSSRNKQITQQLSEDLFQAENTISEKDKQIGEISRVALLDALTGVGSQTAFNQQTKNLEEKIRSEKKPVAVVMMDINWLKNINDSFGHDAGDKYLCGSCKLICNTYKHSPVFRIGGDEFAAILVDTDYEHREELMKKLNAACNDAFVRKDCEPWERYSIAAGMSECADGETTLKAALTRADKAMYAAKRKFKQQHAYPPHNEKQK